MKAQTWSSPQDIRAQTKRCWDDGRLLAARFSGQAMFPLSLRLKAPDTAAIGDQFEQVRIWIRELEESAKSESGYGYRICWREINHRQVGRNRIPEAVVFEREDDVLGWLGLRNSARRFDELARVTVADFPELAAWMIRYPMELLHHADDWTRLLAVLHWFRAHPKPGLYLRQLDIAGADTKFIERRKGILSTLLDIVLPAAQIEQAAVGARQFELRYHLRSKPVLVRFRMLDPALYIAGMSDMSIPAAHFAALDLPIQTVFITENEINGLALPDFPGAMVVFGGGYGIDRLAGVDWLRAKRIVYWGDIDTHGYAILDRLRAVLPHAESMMMDLGTLEAHRPLCGEEGQDTRYLGDLHRLTDGEAAVFERLRDDRLGRCIRLEQERIGFRWVEAAMQTMASSADGLSKIIATPGGALL